MIHLAYHRLYDMRKHSYTIQPNHKKSNSKTEQIIDPSTISPFIPLFSPAFPMLFAGYDSTPVPPNLRMSRPSALVTV